MASYDPSLYNSDSDGICEGSNLSGISHTFVIHWLDQEAKQAYDVMPNKYELEKAHEHLLECLKNGKAELIRILP